MLVTIICCTLSYIITIILHYYSIQKICQYFCLKYLKVRLSNDAQTMPDTLPRGRLSEATLLDRQYWAVLLKSAVKELVNCSSSIKNAWTSDPQHNTNYNKQLENYACADRHLSKHLHYQPSLLFSHFINDDLGLFNISFKINKHIGNLSLPTHRSIY